MASDADSVSAARSDAAASFTNRIIRFLRRIEYRCCDAGEDFEAICRLRYKAYAANGLVPAGAVRKIADELDQSENCFNFGVYYDGELISTLRLHHLAAETPEGPSARVYGDILQPRLHTGERFIDPSRFASDPEWTINAPEVPFVTLRLAVMACIHFDAPFCLSTIRPEHSAFYRRIFNSTQIGPLREYPHFTRKVGLYQADVDTISGVTFTRYPFFISTPVEQRLLFARPANGEKAPLTVLPMIPDLSEAA